MLIIEDLKTKKTTWHRSNSSNTIPTVRSILPGKRRSQKPRRRAHNTPWRALPGTVVMKFGEQLRSSVIREYEWAYLDYDGLKTKLRVGSGPIIGADTPAAASNGKRGKKDTKDTPSVDTSSARTVREWTEDDEAGFVAALENELEKVHQKQQVKAIEIQRMIAVSEREVNDVVNRLRERGTGDGPSEEEFMLLEEDLSDIIADVHDLAKFVQVNYTGFYKIIKKHDVRLAAASIS